MRKIIQIKQVLFIIGLLLLSSNIQAQSGAITGDTSPPYNDNGSTTYYFGDGFYHSFYEWSITGGMELSHWSSGNIYYIQVAWTSPPGSPMSVSFLDMNWLTPVSLNGFIGYPPPSTPSTPTIQSSNCGYTVLTRGTPPSGVTWYWQSNSGGLSTSNSNSTIIRTSGTVYYLKARNNSGGEWSASASVSYTINSAPSTPSAPTITSNCGSTVLTRGSHPSGQTLYWQSSSGGTSTGNSSSTVTRTSGTAYYLRARNNSTGCWSSSRTVSYTINQPLNWYQDQDGDGLGDPSNSQSACSQPSGGYVSNNNDQCPTQLGTSGNNGCPLAGALSDENYIHTTTYRTETATGSVDDDEKIESITYFDGLGRPMQSIGIRAGGNSEDIITHIGYDYFGRQDKDYLPYATSINHGLYRANALNSTTSFYNTVKYENTTNPFSEKHLEASPLSRVLEQGAPGADWAVDKQADTDHTIKFVYQTNSANEVIKFEVTFPTGDTSQPELQLPDSYYEAGELYKTITKGENWKTYDNKDHTTEEFKDKQGRIILKRTYNNQKPHSTYYIYDDYGNLTYVIPPLASDKVQLYDVGLTTLSASAITTTGNATGTVQLGIEKTGTNTYRYAAIFNLHNLENSSFLYSMELPHAHENISGYLGGVSISGNGTLGHAYRYISISAYNSLLNMYNGGGSSSDYNGDPLMILDFSQTNYINLPPTLEGVTEAETQTNLQTVLDDLCYQYKYDSRNRLIEKKIPGKGLEYIVYNKLNQPVLTQDSNLDAQNKWLFTKYDAFGRVAYTGLITTNISSRHLMQSTVDGISSQWVTKSVAANTIGNTIIYYNNIPYPNTNISEIHTINYYDNYTFDGFTNMPTTSQGQAIINYNNSSSTQKLTKGLATGNKVRVLDSSPVKWITTTTGYDEKGRAIYVKSVNEYLKTTDVVENLLDFTGAVTKTKSSHDKGTTTSIDIEDLYTYDHMGRLITQKQKINNQTEELIAKNHYDELGQLVKKDVGNNEALPLQEIDYTYNVRGWLKKINDQDLGLESDLFAFELNYNEGNGAKLYNGNISQTLWKTANDNLTRRYNYYYDDLNRLRSAYYYRWRENSNFNMSASYDKNGNIQSLYRKGATVEQPEAMNSSHYGTMDNLSYTYDGNKLTTVADSGNDTYGFKDGTNTDDDYSYDDNGNMVKDLNKSIGTTTANGITYNHLNLPDEVKFENNNNKKIKYIYDATGVKLKKFVYNNSSTPTTTDYAGNYVYENNVLKQISQPEGYIEPDGLGNFSYVYQFKDHLGNVRLSYKEYTNVTEEVVFSDGFESASGWNKTVVVAGSPLSAFDSTVKHTGSYSGRIDASTGYERYTHSNDWTSINISEPTYYTISAWVFLEDVATNEANMFLFMNTNGETGYYTDVNFINTKIKGQWVYIEKSILVHDYIDKLNIRIGNVYAGKVWFDDVRIVKGNTSNTEIVEENNYYPFGLRHKGYNNNPITNHKYELYNGKEYEESLGLNLYEMDLRSYDPAIGRFNGIDPVTHHSQGTSVAFDNNPIYWADPSGADGVGPLWGQLWLLNASMGGDPNNREWEDEYYANGGEDANKKKNTTVEVGPLESGETGEGWSSLTKEVLINYVSKYFPGKNRDYVSGRAGDLFEDAFIEFATFNLTMFNNFQAVKGRSTESIPDAYSDVLSHGNAGLLLHYKANIIEVKTKNVTLTNQIRGFINELARHPSASRQRNKPVSITFVTLAGNYIHPNVISYSNRMLGKQLGLINKVYHFVPRYRMVKGSMELDFGEKGFFTTNFHSKSKKVKL